MADTIAHPSPQSMSEALANAAQLLRVLGEAGLRSDALQRAIDDPDFRDTLVGVWNEGSAPSDNFVTAEEAARIMGKNFHGPKQIEDYLGVKFTNRQLKRLEIVPWPKKKLQDWANSYVLVPGFQISLQRLVASFPDFFGYQFGDCASEIPPWFGSPHEDFAAHPDRIAFGWHLVRRHPLQSSFGCESWSKAQEGLDAGHRTASAALVAYVAAIHHWSTKEYLFPNSYVLTSDTDSRGRRVILGRTLGGMSVHSDPDSGRLHYGMAVEEKSF